MSNYTILLHCIKLYEEEHDIDDVNMYLTPLVWSGVIDEDMAVLIADMVEGKV